jgi:hypothetical protein
MQSIFMLSNVAFFGKLYESYINMKDSKFVFQSSSNFPKKKQLAMKAHLHCQSLLQKTRAVLM